MNELFEHEYCCGTTCDRTKLEAEFKDMKDKLEAIEECINCDCYFKAKVKHIKEIIKGGKQ